MRNWLVFTQERFSPLSYVPMILLFTGANAFYFTQATDSGWSWLRFTQTCLMMLSFFFRMRLFDEIKDYEVDLKINPTRPLARGLFNVDQFKTALLFLTLLELGLAASLGLWPFLIHVLAIAYSLLMFEEFFIGSRIRPHLTTYATSHTFVSVLLGLSSGVAVADVSLEFLDPTILIFFLANWAFFNLFEFARKTYASEEERPQVPSYSLLFTPQGAYAMSLSQALLGVIVIYYSGITSLFWLPLLLYGLLTAIYFLKPTPSVAKYYRAVSGVYLLAQYLCIIIGLGV